MMPVYAALRFCGLIYLIKINMNDMTNKLSHSIF